MQYIIFSLKVLINLFNLIIETWIYIILIFDKKFFDNKVFSSSIYLDFFI